jgi:hypothetical protein
MVQEFPPNLVRILRSITPPGSPVYEAEWQFYRRGADRSLKHLLTTKVRKRLYSVGDLRELAEEAGWRLSACYGSIEELRGFAPGDYRAFLAFNRV